MNWEVVNIADSFTMINDNNNTIKEINVIALKNENKETKEFEEKPLLKNKINSSKTKINLVINYFLQNALRIIKINHKTKQITIEI